MKHKKRLISIAVILVLLTALAILFCKSYDKMLFLRVDSISVYIPKRCADKYTDESVSDIYRKWDFILSTKEIETLKNDINKDNSPWKKVDENSYQCKYDLTDEKFVDSNSDSDKVKLNKSIEFTFNDQSSEYSAVLTSY